MYTANKNESCYGNAHTAKDGSFVAGFTNNTSFFSLYNPQKDAQNIIAQAQFDGKQFCVVAGLGSAQHIELLLQNPQNTILTVEKNKKSIQILLHQHDFSSILQNPRFFLCTVQELAESIKTLYFPVLSERFCALFVRSWTIQNQSETEQIHSIIQESLRNISADFSVQAHFGKVWHKNILRNLFTASLLNDAAYQFDNQKEAHIIAAGTSLDFTAKTLSHARENKYIIATDTALQVLVKQNIIPDAVVTIDGQNISYLHFMNGFLKNTLLVADLCAHPVATQKALQNNVPVLFMQNAHPFCVYANRFQEQKTGTKPFLALQNRSGTVTVAACDFAISAGFSKILLHGADFSYYKKPYARGVYLDSLYAHNSNRFESAEKQFVSLMFRTELTKPATQKCGCTTNTLKTYAVELETLIANAAQKNICIERVKDFDFQLPLKKFKTTTQKNADSQKLIQKKFLFADFCNSFLTLINQTINQNQSQNLKKEQNPHMLFFPLAAWVQKNTVSGKKNPLFTAVNLAKSTIDLYNKFNYD